MRIYKRIFTRIIFSFISIIISSLILFSIIDLNPKVAEYLNLNYIKYFALKLKYLPDPELVFTRRKKNHTVEKVLTGDIYKPEYGEKPEPIPYIAGYNKEGFRRSTLEGSPEIFVIGDSFIEKGETDNNVITAYIEKLTSIPTKNLGMSWYGPYQYYILLKKHTHNLKVKPRIVLFSYFDGNDIRDIRRYNEWSEGKKSGSINAYHRNNFLQSYFIVLRQLWRYLYDTYIKNHKKTYNTSKIHIDLGLIKVGDRNLKFAFLNYNKHLTTDELLVTKEWKELQKIISQFKNYSLHNNIIPIVLYIPTKIQVYGNFYQDESGHRFKRKIEKQIKYNFNSRDALLKILRDLNLKYIDLLPYFIDSAENGDLLYYQYDTHWNKEGIFLAAQIISDYICSNKLIVCNN